MIDVVNDVRNAYIQGIEHADNADTVSKLYRHYRIFTRSLTMGGCIDEISRKLLNHDMSELRKERIKQLND